MSDRTIVERSDPDFVWLDVIHPSREELADIAERYGLHSTSVNDCLDPEHLPKHEAFESYTFVILRAFDETAGQVGGTVQQMTRKIAIFAGPSFLITIHRTEQPWLKAVAARYQTSGSSKAGSGSSRDGWRTRLITQLLNGAVDTYLRPMEAIEAKLDALEQSVFSGQGRVPGRFAAELKEIHLLKHQVTLIKRLLWRTMDVIQRLTPASGRGGTLFRDVQENVESSHFYADELLDDANTLLHVQLALASHRTGEVMRVLTVFSVFFLPLTFIVGIYGMNFDYMPELRQPWGYPAVLVGMGIVTLVIYLWFRRRGWLRR